MTNLERTKKLLTEAVELFDLNLHDLTVLTEAATGPFFVTPVMAALCGAQVLAIAADSEHGKARDAIENVQRYAQHFGVTRQIKFISRADRSDIAWADIVTNLGFVRPINKSFLSALNKKAVISLFCEPWELRPKDVDVAFCVSHNIPLMGTNEEAAGLNVFSNVGPLMLKMIFQAGLEVYQNNFLIISADKFGSVINKTLIQNGAHTHMIAPTNEAIRINHFNRTDAIIIADYTFEKEIIGANGIISLAELKQAAETHIIHLAGKVNSAFLKEHHIPCYPDVEGHAFKMTKTFSFLGLKPVVDLHAAGLKVAEELVNAAKKHRDYKEIIAEAAKNPLCQPVGINE